MSFAGQAAPLRRRRARAARSAAAWWSAAAAAARLAGDEHRLAAGERAGDGGLGGAVHAEHEGAARLHHAGALDPDLVDLVVADRRAARGRAGWRCPRCARASPRPGPRPLSGSALGPAAARCRSCRIRAAHSRRRSRRRARSAPPSPVAGRIIRPRSRPTTSRERGSARARLGDGGRSGLGAHGRHQVLAQRRRRRALLDRGRQQVDRRRAASAAARGSARSRRGGARARAASSLVERAERVGGEVVASARVAMRSRSRQHLRRHPRSPSPRRA